MSKRLTNNVKALTETTKRRLREFERAVAEYTVGNNNKEWSDINNEYARAKNLLIKRLEFLENCMHQLYGTK